MKTTKIIGLFVAFGLLLCTPIFAQTIPSERTVDWSQAGLLNPIDEPNLLVSVTDYGAIGDGNTNDSPAVQQAIDELSGNPGILFFPAGTYLLTQPIIAYSGLIIKGEGSDLSYLKFYLSSDSQNGIQVSAGQSEAFQSVISGYTKGSSTLELASTSGLETGDFMEMREDNGDWDVVPISWAEHSVGQILQITAINGNQISLNHELRIDYEASLNPQIRKIEPIQQVKIENLKIERLDEPSTGGGKNIYFGYAINCQVSGVESSKSQGSHIYITASSNILVFGNYIHDAFLYDGTATRGYGLTLNMHTGEVLVENNIFRNLRHAMMVKTGANGNVFTYNYAREPHRSEPISNYSGDISVHGHYAYANLFEENICQNIFIDHYWGPGGPLNTFFRNRTELYGIIMTSSSLLETQEQNFVGNEISNSFPYGFFSLTGSNHFEYGNNDGGSAIPTGTTNLDDISYYYSGRPWFVGTSLPFPAIGYPNIINQWVNPAKERYENGETMTEQLDETIGIKQFPEDKPMGIKLLENPVSNLLKIQITQAQESLQFHIYSLTGQVVIMGQIPKNSEFFQINMDQLSSGIYLLNISNPSFRKTIKIEKR